MALTWVSKPEGADACQHYWELEQGYTRVRGVCRTCGGVALHDPTLPVWGANGDLNDMLTGRQMWSRERGTGEHWAGRWYAS